jgi:nucleotide-binding universal stress UspA family protein
MTYRDILVDMDGTAASRARAFAAAATASCAKARLTGLFLKSDFLRTMAAATVFVDAPPLNLDTILKEHADAVERAAEQAREAFEQAAGEAGVQSDWVVVPGDDSKALILHGRRHDLTIFPPVARTTLGDFHVSAAGVAMQTGGPVMIVPEAGFGPNVGERVMLAWNGSREAARALRDAWPLIVQAKHVFVLIVVPEGEGGADGLLQRYMEQHGCKPEVIVDRSADGLAGAVLRRQVRALDIGMVVMGVYGRSRFEEFILGGVSREMTDDPPCGLFISH